MHQYSIAVKCKAALKVPLGYDAWNLLSTTTPIHLLTPTNPHPPPQPPHNQIISSVDSLVFADFQ